MSDRFSLCLRGAAIFAMASTVASAAILLPLWSPSLPFHGAETVAGFVLSGVLGGAAWAARGSVASSLRGAVAFGVGFVIPGLLIPFSLISLQAEVSLLWAAFSWALALGLGGCLAGLLLPGSYRRDLTVSASVGFLVGGAIGGPLAFALFGTARGPGSGRWAFPLGLFVAYAVGGAVFGLLFDKRGSIDKQSPPA